MLEFKPLAGLKYVIDLGEWSEGIRAIIEFQRNNTEGSLEPLLFLRLYQLSGLSEDLENAQVEVRISFKDIDRYIGNTEVIMISGEEMTVEKFVFADIANWLKDTTVYINGVCVNDNLDKFDYIARYME